MIKVYIPGYQQIPIWRQFVDENKYIWGNCKFFFGNCDNYDYLVVIDSLNTITKTCLPKERRILFLGEPPFVKHYTRDFVGQFGHVYSCQQALINKGISEKSIPLLPWMIGCSLKSNSHVCNSLDYMNYKDFINLQNKHLINKACLITSNKKFTKGHRDRVRFADYILSQGIDFIDVFGNGYQSLPDKMEIMSKYKYSVVIENCVYNDYWTEKLSDCFLSGSYPLYYGAPNVSEYFDKDSYTLIDIKRMDESISLIKSIIDNDLYNRNRYAGINAKKLVLDKYNIFALISEKVELIDKTTNTAQLSNVEILKPMKYGFFDKIKCRFNWRFRILI